MNSTSPGVRYQGCGGLVDGQFDPQFRLAELARLEATGEWVAEPKFDGIWIAAIGTTERTLLCSRTSQRKHVPSLTVHSLPPGTVLVGELAYGSQAAVSRRDAVGHAFMDVFDITEYNGIDLCPLRRAGRQAALDGFYTEHPALARHYRRTACWTSGFCDAYQQQAEGLVLKPLDDGPYTRGRSSRWLKAKKCGSSEYVVLDWEASTAASKTGMAKNIRCGGYVPASCVKRRHVYDGRLIAGRPHCLVDLLSVGVSDHAFARFVHDHFASCRGRVIEVGHFGLFDSGAGRHPFLISGPRFREDKLPTECLFCQPSSAASR